MSDVSKKVLICLKREDYAEINVLNEQVIELKNKIDSSWMFTAWLKFTYLVDLSGSTLYKRQYENYHADRIVGKRQELSEAYEYKTTEIIDKIQQEHKEQVIQYETQAKDLQCKVSALYKDIDAAQQKIVKMTSQLKSRHAYNDVEKIFCDVRQHKCVINASTILQLDLNNQSSQEIIKRLSFHHLPSLNGFEINTVYK